MNPWENVTDAIETLPEGVVKRRAIDSIRQLLAEQVERVQTLQKVRDAIDVLRLDTKYLIYDLECTRRERDELKGKLDDR